MVGRRSTPTRERVWAAVRANPGANKSHLCRATGLAWGTLGYHLSKLSRQRRVALITHGSQTLAFPREEVDANWRATAALREPLRVSLLESLQAGPVGIMQVTGEFDVSRKVIRRHFMELVDSGLAMREPGHRGRFALTDLGHEALANGPEWGIERDDAFA